MPYGPQYLQKRQQLQQQFGLNPKMPQPFQVPKNVPRVGQPDKIIPPVLPGQSPQPVVEGAPRSVSQSSTQGAPSISDYFGRAMADPMVQMGLSLMASGDLSTGLTSGFQAIQQNQASKLQQKKMEMEKEKAEQEQAIAEREITVKEKNLKREEEKDKVSAAQDDRRIKVLEKRLKFDVNNAAEERVLKRELETLKAGQETRKMVQSDTKSQDDLRKEYNKESGYFLKTKEAFERGKQGYILASQNEELIARGEEANTQADLALIIDVAKVLDPTSVVREGEISMQRLGSLGEAMQHAYLKNKEGALLTQEERDDIYNIMTAHYNSSLGEQQRRENFYSGVASRRGWTPTEVFPTYTSEYSNASQPANSVPAYDQFK